MVVDALQAQAWLNPDRSVNLAALFSAPAPAPTAAASGAAPGIARSTAAPRQWTGRLGGIEFTEAVFDFDDRAIAAGTRFKFAPVNLRLFDASLDLTQPLRVAIDAVINQHARDDAKGTFTPEPPAASLDIRLEKALMTTLTTDLHYVIRDRQLDAGHKVRIQQLEWGEATATTSEATLPVKFATSLLKDRKGVIDLDVLVGGTLDDPSFRIGPIIWQAIGNIITKAVTAPFTVLGSLFEGAEEARFVDFAPGSAALEPAVAGRLSALGKSLVEKPELTLDVPQVTVPALDMPALAVRAYDAALAGTVAARFGAGGSAAAPAYASLEPARKIEVLTALLMAQTGVASQLPTRAALPAQAAPPEAAARVGTGSESEAAAVEHLEQAARAAVTVSESDLAPLGEQRALALARAVLADSSLDPARIFRASGGKVAASEDMVRFELVLK
jgi:hypothetical protein